MIKKDKIGILQRAEKLQWIDSLIVQCKNE
jgi:hypothetical protein